MASGTTEPTFYPFPRLPLEVRRKIWRSSLPGPRLIDISLRGEIFMSNATIPIGLQICKESRDETLRFYKLCFAAQPSQARIYFNADHDAIYLLTPHSMRLSTYFSLFSLATATIKDDIKVVFVGNGWHWEHTDKASLMPWPGPNCRVVLFRKRCQALSFSTFRQVVDFVAGWYAQDTPSFQVIFGTSKVTAGFCYDKSEGVENPDPHVIETMGHGFDGVVRQCIEHLLLEKWNINPIHTRVRGQPLDSNPLARWMAMHCVEGESAR
ncbi:d9b46385-14bd-4218-9c58-0633c10b0c95-CDS [Sclerotinia trifoliorum]|uniref:D9b46385-14bd-4218-9c58-0633c10b0c95-CDS n=1 Tax=Sclerotinia trifoliorum TaxID=28548 RepID=A0A8H2VTA2_9HELO|nr:d9b46385-14bd-4218-9c58-0633c10b0c95-CDS [Sclerotinia trifoliorum]